MKFLGEKLRELRNAKDLSMTDLCKLTDIKPGYISEIENGKKQPSDKVVEKLSSALQIDQLYFYIKDFRLLTELFPDNPDIKEMSRGGINTPYVAVNEKAARHGISPEDLDELLNIIIKNRK